MPEGPTFVDTHVLLYAHDRAAGRRHHDAVQVVDDLWAHRNGVLSTQILQEFYVNATRKLRPTISRADARDIVTDYATWRVHQVSMHDVLDASVLAERHTLSFWDALVVVAAQQVGASVLLSEDVQQTGTFGALTVRSPFTAAPPSP